MKLAALAEQVGHPQPASMPSQQPSQPKVSHPTAPHPHPGSIPHPGSTPQAGSAENPIGQSQTVSHPHVGSKPQLASQPAGSNRATCRKSRRASIVLAVSTKPAGLEFAASTELLRLDTGRTSDRSTRSPACRCKSRPSPGSAAAADPITLAKRHIATIAFFDATEDNESKKLRGNPRSETRVNRWCVVIMIRFFRGDTW